MNNTTLIRIVLILFTIFFSLCFGYLNWINYLEDGKAVFILESAIIGPFGIYPSMIIKINDIIFYLVISYGVCILPFIFYELRFLNGGSPKFLDNRYSKEEQYIDALIDRLKNYYNSIKTYNRHIIIGLVYLGLCLIFLPTFFLIDANKKIVEIEPIPPYFEKTEVRIDPYYGYTRGAFLIYGVVLIILAIIIYWQKRH